MEKSNKILIIIIVIVGILVGVGYVVYNNVIKDEGETSEKIDNTEENKDYSSFIELARKQTIALDAQTAIEAANTYYMNKSLTTGNGFPSVEGETKCITIAELISDGYFGSNISAEGKVEVIKYGTSYLFKVWLHKNDYMVVGAGSDGTKNITIKGTNDSTSDVVKYNEKLFSGTCN